MTITEDRPTAPGADRGDWLPLPVTTRGTWRLASRLAWREVVRRRLRTALVMALIAVPTAAMVLAAVAYRTDQRFSNAYGSRGPADVVLRGPERRDPATLGLPAGTDAQSYLFSQVAVAPTEPPPALNSVGGDGTAFVTITDLPIGDAHWAGLVTIESGRPPVVGELLLSPDTARLLGVKAGDQLTFERPSGTWTVSGIGRFAPDYWTDLMVVPGFDAERVVASSRQFETVIDLPPGTSDSEVSAFAAKLDGVVPGQRDWEAPSDAAGLTLGWLIGAMAFLAFGIVVAAAFATSARHQLLAVGQLAANGAPQRLITRMLSWQGWWSGVLGGVAGTLLAFGAMPIVQATAQRHLFHATVGWVVRPLDIVVIVATASAAGLLAALVPSRSLARTTVLAALAGRRPVGEVPRRLLPVGVTLLAGGTGLITLAMLASRDQADAAPFLIAAVLGGGGIAVGTCCVSPWIVARFARLAPRLPLAGRLSLRSLARARGRSAAVVSAIAVTVALTTAVVGGFERELNVQLDGDRYLPRDTVVINHWTDRLSQALGTREWPDQPPASVEVPPLAASELRPEARTHLDRVLPGAARADLRHAVSPGGRWPTNEVAGPTDMRVPIGDPAALSAGGWSTAAAEALAEHGYVTYGRPGNEAPAIGWAVDGTGQEITPTVIEDPAAPRWTPFTTLMTVEYAQAHGLDVVTTGSIVRAADPLTATERDGVGELWRELDPAGSEPFVSFVEPGDDPAVAAGDASTPAPGVARETSEGAVTLTPPEQFGWWNVEYQWVDDSAERELWIARGIALGAAVLLIGVVVAIGLALAAADQRAERNVLAVAGARPAALRRMAAWNAVTMTLVGITVGVPVGFVPAWVVVRAVTSTNRGLPFPWLFVATLVAVVPAVMLAVTWAGSAVAGRFGHQPSPRRAD